MKREVWLAWFALCLGALLACEQRPAAGEAHVSREPHVTRLEL